MVHSEIFQIDNTSLSFIFYFLGGFSWLYLYPRFSIITMDDHNHAAFYPEINNSTDPSLYNFTRQGKEDDI